VSHDDVRSCGLATAVTPHNSVDFSRFYDEVDALED